MDVIIASKGGRSRRRSGQATREQLLGIAATLFARKGLHGVTLAEIAGEAGMSGPAIYNHFRSKDALFSEVVSLMYDEEVAAFRGVLDPLDSVQEALERLLELVPRMYREDGVLQLLGLTAQLEAVRNPELFSSIAEAAERRDQVAVDLVHRAKRRGEIPSEVDAHELGALLMSLFIGALGYRSLRAPRQEQFAHSVETFRGLLRVLQRTSIPDAEVT
ncbi:HTH-type transcriptional regulator AcrR [compost metagenome]